MDDSVQTMSPVPDKRSLHELDPLEKRLMKRIPLPQIFEGPILGGGEETTEPEQSKPTDAATTVEPTVTIPAPTITTTIDPPVPTATTTIPQTTAIPTMPTATTTTTTTTEDKPSPAPSHVSPAPSHGSPAPSKSSKPTSKPSDKPHGTSGPGGPSKDTTSNSSAASPTSTATNPEESSGPPVLPIVLGSVLGLGALIGAGVFFCMRFRKNRRFDSKRPLSFLALSLEDPSLGGKESASARALSGTAVGSDAIYDSSRPITSQPSLRYTPPVMSGILDSSSRHSYQSPSEHSGATGAQFAQWSQDDENAALVGGPSRQQQLMMTECHSNERGSRTMYSQEHDLALDDQGYPLPRSDSAQSFVATSMLPLAPDDPIRDRYNRQQLLQQQQQGSPILPQQDVSLRALNADVEQQEDAGAPAAERPLSVHSVHSNAASVLSVRNPSEALEHQPSVRSTTGAGARGVE